MVTSDSYLNFFRQKFVGKKTLFLCPWISSGRPEGVQEGILGEFEGNPRAGNNGRCPLVMGKDQTFTVNVI